jgi:hypothetical protein
MRRSTWVLLGVFLAVLALYVVVRPDPAVDAAPVTKKVTRPRVSIPTSTPTPSRSPTPSAKPTSPVPRVTPTAPGTVVPSGSATPTAPVTTGTPSRSSTPTPLLPLPSASPTP